MIEAGPSRPQAEEILVIKDEIAERWNCLPPEHQASMALTLSSNVIDGEYGPWLLTAIALLHPEIDVPLPLSDEHLRQVGFSDEELRQLNEADRQNIRQRMIDHWLCQDQFEIPQNDQVENPQLKRSVRAGRANSPCGPNCPAGQAGHPSGAFRASDNSGREY